MHIDHILILITLKR